MFDIYGCHFNYAGFDSAKYDLVFGNMDTSRMLTLQGAQEVNTVYSKRNQTHYLTSVSYSNEQLSFDAEIFTVDGGPIGESFLPAVETALFHRGTYGKLYGFQGYHVDPVYINCLLINPERIETEAGVVGYKFTIVTDSVMSWVPEVTFDYSFSGSELKTFSVEVDSDINDYIYPVVTFQMGQTGGDITLYNNTDDATRMTAFTGITAETSFQMDSRTNYISNDNYSKFSERNFIRLLNGTNNFVLLGDVSGVSFNFNNRKFI